MQHSACRALCAALLALVWCLPGTAGAEDKESDAEQCLRLASIDHTEVVDDTTILFHMKNGDVYRNKLPYRCPGLRRERAFMYRTSLNQLCNVDIITVLSDIGFGFTPGASCGLGMFHPVRALTADELLHRDEEQ